MEVFPASPTQKNILKILLCTTFLSTNITRPPFFFLKESEFRSHCAMELC